MDKRYNAKEFSFAEMTSNSSGKTSASGTMGILVCAVGCFTFILGSVTTVFFSGDGELLTQSTLLIYAGAALLGYRKSKDYEIFDIPGEIKKKAKVSVEGEDEIIPPQSNVSDAV